MPCTSISSVNNGSNFDCKLNIAKPKTYVDFAFWKGLKDDSTDFICTDHAAGEYPEEKLSSNIWKVNKK